MEVKGLARTNKKVCLKKNGNQGIKLRNSSINFKNYFRQLAVPFKIFADFEPVLKRIHSDDTNNNTSYTKRYIAHIPCSFVYKVVCIDTDLASQLFFKEEQMQSINLLKQFLKKITIAKKCWKSILIKICHVCRRWKSFKLSNKWWICNKLFAEADNKVRDNNDHVTLKYWGSAPWNWIT